MRLSRTLGLATLVGLALSLNAHADTTITVPQNSTIQSWGFTGTATYGQVVTAPLGESFLSSFTFTFSSSIILSATLQYRANVFAWDGNSASGPALFSSVILNSPAGLPTSATINTGSVPVTAGSQYVLFFSTSGLQKPGPFTTYSFAANNTNAYAGGTFVFLNNGNDTSQWTEGVWSNFGGQSDLAFTARFITQAPNAPEPGTLALLTLGVAGGMLARRRK